MDGSEQEVRACRGCLPAWVRLPSSCQKGNGGGAGGGSESQYRVVHVNDQQANDSSRFRSNWISTTSYTYVNFLFLNLFHQFKRPANWFYCLVIVLQVQPATTLTKGKPSLMQPFILILFMTALKDFIQFRRRRNADRSENHAHSRRLQGGAEVPVLWEDIKCGNLILIKVRLPASGSARALARRGGAAVCVCVCVCV